MVGASGVMRCCDARHPILLLRAIDKVDKANTMTSTIHPSASTSDGKTKGNTMDPRVGHEQVI